jgi:hypothetical protein
LPVKAFYLDSREKGEFALMISTRALFTVIRIVGSHAKILTGNVIKIKTYNGEPTDKNEIGVKLTTLGIRDSARHKRTLLSGRKH